MPKKIAKTIIQVGQHLVLLLEIELLRKSMQITILKTYCIPAKLPLQLLY